MLATASAPHRSKELAKHIYATRLLVRGADAVAAEVAGASMSLNDALSYALSSDQSWRSQ